MWLYVLLLASAIAYPQNDNKKIKVLHLTFHKGCLADFEEVAQELNLALTSWWAHDDNYRFEGKPFAGGEIYNINPKRAARIWQKNRDFFESFDVIITSDTAPLSRIFLQHGWKKPLIIWVCNRFDYASGGGKELPFPDKGYYDLIQHATQLPNVRIVSYTPYEYIYAQRKGMRFSTHTIKPIGKKMNDAQWVSAVPSTIDKKNTLLLFPRLEPHNVQAALQECAKRAIGAWTGKYNGPDDLEGFKGVLFFPYAYSNIALFENLQRGIVHFVPTKKFLLKLGYIWDGTLRSNLDWCEWYADEYKDVFVFFDSWDELKDKVTTTNYAALKEQIRSIGARHRTKTLAQWNTLFDELMAVQ